MTDGFPVCSMYLLFCDEAVTLSEVMVSRMPCLWMYSDAKLGTREKTLSQACIVSTRLNIDKNVVV
jgi:hypothetical protein